MVNAKNLATSCFVHEFSCDDLGSRTEKLTRFISWINQICKINLRDRNLAFIESDSLKINQQKTYLVCLRLYLFLNIGPADQTRACVYSQIYITDKAKDVYSCERMVLINGLRDFLEGTQRR